MKHFSIFLHNKVGALLEVVKFFEQKGVIVLAFSIVDSAESAIARMIVSDPLLVGKLLHERDIAYVETTVLVVELAEGAADLGRVLNCLLMAEVTCSSVIRCWCVPAGRPCLFSMWMITNALRPFCKGRGTRS